MGEQTGLAHRVDADGILQVVFDLPGQRVNLLTLQNLQELGRLLDEARSRDEIRAVFFASAKPGISGGHRSAGAKVCNRGNDAHGNCDEGEGGQALQRANPSKFVEICRRPPQRDSRRR